MRILGVNGIYNWSWSDDSFTDKLLKQLGTMHEVVDIQYPWMFAVFAYSDFAINRRAKEILKVNKPTDILIAHSFGCLASIYAMRQGAKFDKVFFFGAAADDDIAIPRNAFNELYNIHSEADIALELGSILPFHQFGPMGKTGYHGTNEKVINVKASGLGHNDYVLPGQIAQWVKFIEEHVQNSQTSPSVS